MVGGRVVKGYWEWTEDRETYQYRRREEWRLADSCWDSGEETKGDAGE